MISIPRLIMDDGHNIAIPSVSIVPATSSHISALKLNLRPEDAEEIVRFGVTIQKAVWYSYKHSLIRKTALINGIVAACWGCSGVFMGQVGIPWLMTTPEVKKVSPLRFARIYQQEVMEMLKIFPRLENSVDSEYDSAIRLLEIIGFTIENPQKIPNGMCRKFWIEA